MMTATAIISPVEGQKVATFARRRRMRRTTLKADAIDGPPTRPTARPATLHARTTSPNGLDIDDDGDAADNDPTLLSVAAQAREGRGGWARELVIVSFQTWEENGMRFAAVPFYHATAEDIVGGEAENGGGSR